MRFELHCHSRHSRGSKIPTEALTTPREIFRVLKKKGFAGAAVTDHDTTKAWKEAKSEARKLGMAFIPGLEISTRCGHLIGLGMTEGIRCGMGVEETVEKIRSQGGVSVAPHPFDLRNEGLGIDFMKCDAAEVFNSLNLSRIENIVARRKIGRTDVSGVGGSDAHTKDMLGLTANIIEAHDAEEALKAIRKGKVKVEGRYVPVPVVVSWARERMKSSRGDILMYMDRNYSSPKAAVSKFLMDRFINSESRLWNGLGYFGVGTAVLYSAARNSFRRL